MKYDSAIINATKYETYENKFILDQKIIRDSHSFHNIALQAIVGSVSSAIFFLPPLALSASATWGNSDQGLALPLAILSFSAFVFGNGVGVYLISNIENPAISFWSIVEYSYIGAGVAVMIIAIASTEYSTIPPAYGITAAVCPLLSSIIYTSFITEWQVPSENQITLKKVSTHQDLINYSKVFDLELLRYEF